MRLRAARRFIGGWAARAVAAWLDADFRCAAQNASRCLVAGLLRGGDRRGPGDRVGLDRAGHLPALLVRLGRGHALGVAPHQLAPFLDDLEPDDVVGRVPARVGQGDERVVALGDLLDDLGAGALEQGVEAVVVGLARATVGAADPERRDDQRLVALHVRVDPEEQVLGGVGLAAGGRVECDLPGARHGPAVHVVVDGAEVVVGEDDVLEDQVVGVVKALRPTAQRLGGLLRDLEVGGGEDGAVVAAEAVAQRGHPLDDAVDAGDVGVRAAGSRDCARAGPDRGPAEALRPRQPATVGARAGGPDRERGEADHECVDRPARSHAVPPAGTIAARGRASRSQFIVDRPGSSRPIVE